MDLKETIISSFFFHLILFLLMIAVSSYTTGLSGGIQDIVSVDLVMDDSKEESAARSESADEPSQDSGLPSDKEISLPDQTVSSPPEESNKIPEPEKKAEAETEPPKIEPGEKPPAQRQGFPSLEAYIQFIVLHKKIFRQEAGARVNQLLGEALKVNKREFYGGTALVSLTFGPDGKLNKVHVDSASPDLKAFLEEIGWGVVPPPAAYPLGYAGVQIEFTVFEGNMSFDIKVL
jgi:hypothetical protein